MTVTRDGGADNAPRYTFDASGSIPDGRIDQFTWDFGDGSYGSGESTSHTYATPGRFTVTLSILDDRGNPDSTSETVAAGDITAIDLGEIAGNPQLDPNVFAALGAEDPGGAGSGDGSGGFPWLALLLGGLVVVGAVLVLRRFLPRPSAPVPPPASATDAAPSPAASDLPETVGDSGITYAQTATGATESVDAKLRRGHYNLASIASGSHMVDRTLAGEPITQKDYEMQVQARDLMSRGGAATSTFVGEGVVTGSSDVAVKGLTKVITTVQGWFGGNQPPPTKP